ncbi:hypothetical protein BST27_26360 [Mycobacterium intermedium]|uniref:Secreted protein n=1 Tax=Mycobacterium intermedium TaxID=28445 RepID=A0A1E3SCI7_MYCIE|nr:hypothetical protein [Mycobacterium intermedium]MCV6962472.1 hypothetical protein [Mycobacterium intermedium]ODQ99804.1 hypothetical protein BHQ20_15720 [Mycobacterium intermedium]OPE46198.1 hypothetical protein BV508_26890 [Mycobacterium intermedium]ORA95730.1 hypothetical protein BST27_26360 [Mycobacterium intermedium]
MRDVRRAGTSAAAITFAAFLGLGTASAAPEPSGPTRVPLNAYLRNCDFSKVQNAVQIPLTFNGQGTAIVRKSGSSVVADIQMVIASGGPQHYDVVMIPTPRASSNPCGPGAPGTTTVGLDTNEGGIGSATIGGTLPSGSTGVWFSVSRPGPNNQAPAEYYSSEFAVPL